MKKSVKKNKKMEVRPSFEAKPAEMDLVTSDTLQVYPIDMDKLNGIVSSKLNEAMGFTDKKWKLGTTKLGLILVPRCHPILVTDEAIFSRPQVLVNAKGIPCTLFTGFGVHEVVDGIMSFVPVYSTGLDFKAVMDCRKPETISVREFMGGWFDYNSRISGNQATLLRYFQTKEWPA